MRTTGLGKEKTPCGLNMKIVNTAKNKNHLNDEIRSFSFRQTRKVFVSPKKHLKTQKHEKKILSSSIPKTRNTKPVIC